MSAEHAALLALAWGVAALAVIVAAAQSVRAHRLDVARLGLAHQVMAVRIRAAAQVAALSSTRRRP